MTWLSRTALAAGACLLLAAPPVIAQEQGVIPVPLVEFSAGYSFVRDFEDVAGDDGFNMPLGWFASGGVNVNRWLGLIGEASGSYRDSIYGQDFGSGFSFDNDVRQYTLLGGPRFFYKRGRFAPYAQMLAGAAHSRLRTHWNAGPFGGGTDTNTDTSLMLQPGGGIMVFLTDSLGIRLAGDYRSILDWGNGDGVNETDRQFRLASGLTFNWGSR